MRIWAILFLAGVGAVVAYLYVSTSSRADPAKLSLEVRDAISRKEWGRAEGLLAQLSRKRLGSSDDLALRAELEVGRGRLDEALGLLARVPASDLQAPGARLVAAQIEKSRHRARHTESLLLEALRLDPTLVLARRELIFLYAMQARRADLNAQYRALAELEPLNFDEVFFWMNSYENVWVNQTIRSHLEAYLAADPDDRASRLALSAVLLHENELENAEALVLPLPDSDPDARVLRARFALARSRDDDLRSILAGGPVDHVGLALLRGHFAARMNDPRSAAEQFRIVLLREPDNREALQALTVVLKQLGDGQGAASAQKQADQWRNVTSLLQKSKVFDLPSDKTLLTQLAKASEAVGQIPEARAWYRLALAQDPLDSALQQVLFRLRPSPLR
jgi:tetratricopeptide (TPR) repeat protein